MIGSERKAELMTHRRLGQLLTVAITSLGILAADTPCRAAGVKPKSGCRYHWPYLRKRVEVPLNHEYGYTPTFWRQWDEDPNAQFSPMEVTSHTVEEVPEGDEALPPPDGTTEPGLEESTVPEESTEPDESMLPGGAEPELPAEAPLEEPSFPTEPTEEMPGELPAEPEGTEPPAEGAEPPAEGTEPATTEEAPRTTPESGDALPPAESTFENPEPPAETAPEEGTTPAAPESNRGRQAQRMYIDDSQAVTGENDPYAQPASHDAAVDPAVDAEAEIDWPELTPQEAASNDPTREFQDEAGTTQVEHPEEARLSDVARGFSRVHATSYAAGAAAPVAPTQARVPGFVTSTRGNGAERPVESSPELSSTAAAESDSPAVSSAANSRALAILDGPASDEAESLPAEPAEGADATDREPMPETAQWRSGSPRPAVNESRQWSRPSTAPRSNAVPRAETPSRWAPPTANAPRGERLGAPRAATSANANRPLPTQSTRTPSRSATRTASPISGEIQMGQVAPASYYEKAKPPKTKKGGLFGGLLGSGK